MRQKDQQSVPPRSSRILKIIVFSMTALALSVAGLSSAAADDDIMSSPEEPQDVLGTTEDSSEPNSPETVPLTAIDPVTSVGTGPELVSTTAGNKTVAIEVLGADRQDRIMASGGATLIRDVIGDVDVKISVLETGFAIVAELESAESPHELRFNVSLPEGAILGLNDDGSIDVIDRDGFSIGTFAVPWASDASGSVVPTAYSIEGSVIVQTVDTVSEDLYPVSVDPEFNWGILSGTIYFSRSETRDICLGGISVLTAMLYNAPLWAASIVANVVALGVLFVTTQVCLIYMFGECLKLKSYPGFIFSYTGGYCR